MFIYIYIYVRTGRVSHLGVGRGDDTVGNPHGNLEL